MIEGYVEPCERLRDEGPFGDPAVTGQLHVARAVSGPSLHRHHAPQRCRLSRHVYPVTIVGKMNFPEIVDLVLPPACAWPHADRAEGVFHHLVLVNFREVLEGGGRGSAGTRRFVGA